MPITSTGRISPHGVCSALSSRTSSRSCDHGRDVREPRLRARWQATTVARPLAIAAAACISVALDAPPPYEILSHQVSCRTPRRRAIETSWVRLHLEHRHAVDVLGLEPGVVERELDGLDRGVGDRPADVLGERQVADADDRPPCPGCDGRDRGRGRRTRHPANTRRGGRTNQRQPISSSSNGTSRLMVAKCRSVARSIAPVYRAVSARSRSF